MESVESVRKTPLLGCLCIGASKYKMSQVGDKLVKMSVSVDNISEMYCTNVIFVCNKFGGVARSE